LIDWLIDWRPNSVQIPIKQSNQTDDKNTNHDHRLCFYHLVGKFMGFLTKYVVAIFKLKQLGKWRLAWNNTYNTDNLHPLMCQPVKRPPHLSYIVTDIWNNRKTRDLTQLYLEMTFSLKLRNLYYHLEVCYWDHGWSSGYDKDKVFMVVLVQICTFSFFPGVFLESAQRTGSSPSCLQSNDWHVNHSSPRSSHFVQVSSCCLQQQGRWTSQ